MYHHKNQYAENIQLPVGKAVCIGRNYAEHASELGNDVPKEPILFIKPHTAMVDFSENIKVSGAQYDKHYELEIAVLIVEPLIKASRKEVLNAIGGIGLALDLTYRDLQNTLKAQGLPWEKAKAFDGSCVLSGFATHITGELNDLEMALMINGELKQHGFAKDMLFDIPDVIAHASQHFTLLPGDVVLTGTPSGVGVLRQGDELEAELLGVFMQKTTCI